MKPEAAIEYQEYWYLENYRLASDPNIKDNAIFKMEMEWHLELWLTYGGGLDALQEACNILTLNK